MNGVAPLGSTTGLHSGPSPTTAESRRGGSAHGGRRRVRGVALVALVVALSAGVRAPFAAAQAQQVGGASLRVEMGVEPDRVTVGDHFRSMVRVAAPAGYAVRFLEFESGDSLAALAAPAIVDSRDGRTAAIYPLVAWAVASDLGATVRVEVTAPDGSTRAHQLRLRLPEVVSVLPADTSGIEPRPARGTVASPVAKPFPWWWLALLLLALLLGWLLYRYLRRERAVPEVDPRVWALQQLEEQHLRATLPAGDPIVLVEHLSGVLREYVWRTDPALGRDLTTTELLGRIHARPGGAGSEMVTVLGGLLAQADRVKFARHRPHAAEAADLLTAARNWISRFPEAPASNGEMRRAA